MSVFPRIDPDHPLTIATREIDDVSAELGIEDVVLRYMQGTVSAGELAYLGEQRAMRAGIVHSFPDLIGPGVMLTEEMFRKLLREDWWYENRETLISLYANGVLTGWHGRGIAPW